MRWTGERRPVSRRARQLGVLLAFAVAGVAIGRLVVLVLHVGEDAGSAPVTAPVGRPGGTRLEPALDEGARRVPDRDGRRTLARAAEVLHAWDADRAAAYARGDPAALRGLYLPGSRAGTRDVRLLRAYAERGLVVRGLRTQVLALGVTTATPRRMVLRVTDRRVDGRAVLRGDDEDTVALPRDAPSSRVLVLHHRDGRWRMAAVSDT